MRVIGGSVWTGSGPVKTCWPFLPAANRLPVGPYSASIRPPIDAQLTTGRPPGVCYAWKCLLAARLLADE